MYRIDNLRYGNDVLSIDYRIAGLCRIRISSGRVTIQQTNENPECVLLKIYLKIENRYLELSTDNLSYDDNDAVREFCINYLAEFGLENANRMREC